MSGLAARRMTNIVGDGAFRPVTPGLRWTLWVSALLLLFVGIPLLILSGSTKEHFAWAIKPPLTAAYLGGFYWASLAGVVAAVRRKWWAEARAILPVAVVFTAFTLAATLIHLNKFATDSVRGWAWIATYVVAPPVFALMLIRQERLPGPDPPKTVPFRAWVSALLALYVLVLLPLGVALFAAPGSVDGVWPWALTPLTARAVAAGLLALGAAAAHALFERDWRRVASPAVSFAVLAVLEAIALVRYHDTVDWAGWRVWVFMLFLTSMLVLWLESVRGIRKSGPR